MNDIVVSVIIVSMNNPQILFPCLNSIKDNTKDVKYEIIVVAYLFSEENLQQFKKKYPDVKIIESNEIRGFAENNNLALKIAKGKYFFIVNDDTYFSMPVIDLLAASFEVYPEADFFSPVIIDGNGLITNGRPPATILSYVLYSFFRLSYISKKHKKYINQSSVYQTYNIAGCAFMVKNTIIKELGYFNEEYFFCPEDIELSTIANEKGYKCFVNPSIIIHHHQSKSFNKVSTAIYPAMQKGLILFYSRKSKALKILLNTIAIISYSIFLIYWLSRNNEKARINRQRYLNAIKSSFSSSTPKELFVKYYKSLQAKSK